MITTLAYTVRSETTNEKRKLKIILSVVSNLVQFM